MSETVLSVCWKDHTSELATVYKSLLENNFLVDCTISAEGQTLKAHRLVLSACSPYFHMLFREETGKHTFVILLDASFVTLKAVIDFVYRGEIQIPEGNLKAFLTLAQSLQIKGLNDITQHYKNKNRSSSLTGNTSVCEDVRSASLMTLLQEDPKPQCDEVSEDAEITVKHEPLHAVFSETRSEKLDSVKIVEGTTKNFISEVDGRTSLYGEEELNFFSKPIKKEAQDDCNESSHGNVDISVMPTAQEQQMQLSFELSSGQDVAETNDPLQFAILVPKIEHLDDKDSEELMDDSDLSGNGANEIGDGTEPAFGEQHPDECSKEQRTGYMNSRNQAGSTQGGRKEDKMEVEGKEMKMSKKNKRRQQCQMKKCKNKTIELCSKCKKRVCGTCTNKVVKLVTCIACK